MPRERSLIWPASLIQSKCIDLEIMRFFFFNVAKKVGL